MYEVQNSEYTYLTTSHIDELSPPDNISLSGASPSKLVFEWSSVTHDCSALNYNIMTSTGCGTCPTSASSNTATCSIHRLQPNEVRLCSFRVQAVLCNSTSGQLGNANFTLKGTKLITL